MSTQEAIIAAIAAAAIVAIIGWIYGKFLFNVRTGSPQRAWGKSALAISVLAILGILGTYMVVNSPILITPSTSTLTSGPTVTPIITLTATNTFTGIPSPIPVVTPTALAFNIYTDAGVLDNHFTPSGFIGDIGDIIVDETWIDNPHTGTSSIKIDYSPEGRGPNVCHYEPRCKWAGVYWLSYPNNWGVKPGVGYDLRGFNTLTFWARSDTDIKIEFKVGGIIGAYPDSVQPARSSGRLTLSPQWQQYIIDLGDADLSNVIGGFAWVASWDYNAINKDSNNTLMFFLDDIRFER